MEWIASSPISISVFMNIWALLQPLWKKYNLYQCVHSLYTPLLCHLFSLFELHTLLFIVIGDDTITRFIQFLKFNFRFNFIRFFCIYFYVCIQINLYIRMFVGHIYRWHRIPKYSKIENKIHTHTHARNNSYEKKTKIMT